MKFTNAMSCGKFADKLRLPITCSNCGIMFVLKEANSEICFTNVQFLAFLCTSSTVVAISGYTLVSPKCIKIIKSPGAYYLNAYTEYSYTVPRYLSVAQHSTFHTTGKFPSTNNLEVTFKILYVYDFINNYAASKQKSHKLNKSPNVHKI
jgi:hypothetical protein